MVIFHRFLYVNQRVHASTPHLVEEHLEFMLPSTVTLSLFGRLLLVCFCLFILNQERMLSIINNTYIIIYNYLYFIYTIYGVCMYIQYSYHVC